MVKITPPAGFNTLLTIFDHNGVQVQPSHQLYQLIDSTRKTILSCPGFLEAIAEATFIQPQPLSSPAVGQRARDIRHYLWTARLLIQCRNFDDYGRTTPLDQHGSRVIMELHGGLVAQWFRLQNRDYITRFFTRNRNNLRLLTCCLHIVVLHEYMHVITNRFGPQNDTPPRVTDPTGGGTEMGFWAEGWLSQHGKAIFVFDKGQTMNFARLHSLHFVRQDNTFIQITKSEHGILKTLARGKWRPMPQRIEYQGNDWIGMSAHSDRARPA
ncbi:hypothetical protein BDR04DRAFT_1108922 [Suillus decipiens]|nr:hypothetical protein BDR04DRAFT_1108922 [Suillus decipiens]